MIDFTSPQAIARDLRDAEVEIRKLRQENSALKKALEDVISNASTALSSHERSGAAGE